jgi:hypothetical protein
MRKEERKSGDYLKSAEMSLEANENMVDGLVNNLPPPKDDLTDGQTYDEIRNLAPETLPEARQEKKPSVKEYLNAAPERASAATAKRPPHRGADRER